MPRAYLQRSIGHWAPVPAERVGCPSHMDSWMSICLAKWPAFHAALGKVCTLHAVLELCGPSGVQRPAGLRKAAGVKQAPLYFLTSQKEAHATLVISTPDSISGTIKCPLTRIQVQAIFERCDELPPQLRTSPIQSQRSHGLESMSSIRC